MNYTTLKIKEEKQFLILTIHRPEKLNALSQTVLAELEHFLSNLLKSPSGIHGLVLTGEGEKSFIAGADIQEMSGMNEDEGEIFGALGQRVTQLFETLPIPVIACVNGYAFGGGCEMALACDLIYAVESASFAQPEVNLGLIPGFGGCVRLIRRVGPGHAKSMIYTGKRVSAREAERIGLVDQVFPDRSMMLKAASNFFHEVAMKSPFAVSICKSVINRADGESLVEGLEFEKQGFRAAFSHADMNLGTSAFLKKESPTFSPLALSDMFLGVQLKSQEKII